jgi:hypothetical protein
VPTTFALPTAAGRNVTVIVPRFSPSNAKLPSPSTAVAAGSPTNLNG